MSIGFEKEESVKPFTIGKVAQATGLGVETIRFYERRGLITQPRRPHDGGARNYGEKTVARLRFIRQGREIGFSLAEISDLLSMRDSGAIGCESVRARAISKRQEIDQKMETLSHMGTVLDDLIARCPGRGDLANCSIFAAMDGTPECR